MSEIFNEILQSGSRTHYKEGKFLFYRGDIGNSFYIVEKGSVELSIFDINGEKVILSEVKKGDFFGQIEIFTNGIRPTNAYINPGTQISSFSALIVKDFLSRNNDKALEIIEGLCSIIDQGITKIEDILVLNAYQKVSKKLYELGEAAQSNHLYISQKKMSEFLALSERTTNISLQKLKEKGAIYLRRSRIEILDIEMLKNAFINHEQVV